MDTIKSGSYIYFLIDFFAARLIFSFSFLFLYLQNVCNVGNDVTITDEGEEYVVREGDREIARVMSDVILTPPDCKSQHINQATIRI